MNIFLILLIIYIVQVLVNFYICSNISWEEWKYNLTHTHWLVWFPFVGLILQIFYGIHQLWIRLKRFWTLLMKD